MVAVVRGALARWYCLGLGTETGVLVLDLGLSLYSSMEMTELVSSRSSRMSVSSMRLRMVSISAIQARSAAWLLRVLGNIVVRREMERKVDSEWRVACGESVW